MPRVRAELSCQIQQATKWVSMALSILFSFFKKQGLLQGLLGKSSKK